MDNQKSSKTYIIKDHEADVSLLILGEPIESLAKSVMNAFVEIVGSITMQPTSIKIIEIQKFSHFIPTDILNRFIYYLDVDMEVPEELISILEKDNVYVMKFRFSKTNSVRTVPKAASLGKLHKSSNYYEVILDL